MDYITELGTPKIWVGMGGWEQTNVDFYQVVKETEKSMWLRKLNKVVMEFDSSLTGIAMPIIDDFRGDEILQRRKKWGNEGDLLPLPGEYCYKYIRVWDGKEKRFSTYA